MYKYEVTRDEIRSAYLNSVPLHVKNQIKILPEWSDFIKNIDESIKKETLDVKSSNPSSKILGSLRVFDTLAFSIDHSVNYQYPGIVEMNDYLSSLGLQPFTAISFINLAGGQNTTTRHSDGCSVLYIQVINSVKWVVNINETDKEFILEPGDIMFMPKGVEHEVFSSAPRAAVSFAVSLI